MHLLQIARLDARAADVARGFRHRRRRIGELPKSPFGFGNDGLVFDGTGCRDHHVGGTIDAVEIPEQAFAIE